MLRKYAAVLAVLAIIAGNLMADDKEGKKDTKKPIKGTVSKFDNEKHTLKVKTDDGEKEYTLDEDVVVVFGTGQKVKPKEVSGGQQKGRGAQMLVFVLKEGNEVGLVLAEKDKVKEIHWDNKNSSAAPKGKPAGAPDGKAATKKDDGKAATKKDSDKK